MSETRNVTFMESVQLFDEMVVEKYFKTVDTEDLMLCIAGNADSSALHVTACGNSESMSKSQKISEKVFWNDLTDFTNNLRNNNEKDFSDTGYACRTAGKLR